MAVRTYRGITIDHYPTGWWSALTPRGYVKADTLDGVKEMIRRSLDGSSLGHRRSKLLPLAPKAAAAASRKRSRNAATQPRDSFGQFAKPRKRR